MTTKEMIEVMQAYEEGKTIEALINGRWIVAEHPSWDWNNYIFRIAPLDKFSVEWFTEEMKELAKDEDVEGRHCNMDELMCELLEHLGYSDGVKIFRDTDMWYA